MLLPRPEKKTFVEFSTSNATSKNCIYKNSQSSKLLCFVMTKKVERLLQDSARSSNKERLNCPSFYPALLLLNYSFSVTLTCCMTRLVKVMAGSTGSIQETFLSHWLKKNSVTDGEKIYKIFRLKQFFRNI